MIKPFKILVLIFAMLLISNLAFAQKGIDTQTKTIKDESANNAAESKGKTFTWGRGKTKIRERMDNPLIVNSRYDILLDTVSEILKEGKMIIDEESSRYKKGLIVTRPFTFTRGAILSKNELGRYAIVPNTRDVWTRGQFNLTVDIKSIDGMRNRVSATAKVEGRIGDGLYSEWTTLPSSGEAEDEFLVELAKRIGIKVAEEERKP